MMGGSEESPTAAFRRAGRMRQSRESQEANATEGLMRSNDNHADVRRTRLDEVARRHSARKEQSEMKRVNARRVPFALRCFGQRDKCGIADCSKLAAQPLLLLPFLDSRANLFLEQGWQHQNRKDGAPSQGSRLIGGQSNLTHEPSMGGAGKNRREKALFELFQLPF